MLPADSNYTTSWDDACGFCEKECEATHKRSGGRTRGDRDHGENGLSTVHTNLIPLFFCHGLSFLPNMTDALNFRFIHFLCRGIKEVWR